MERDAFISYSHKRDVPLAKALQEGLQGFLRTPWLHRPGAKVFRDTTSLSASHDLGGAIKAALATSRHFIYLASPEAAESRWVREEITYWRQNHGMDHFLIALSDGEVAWDPAAGDFDWTRTNALPPELRGAFATEPLWVDLRKFRDCDERSMAPGAEFRDRVASLASALHGMPKDALDSEDLRRQRKAVRVLRGFVAALAFLLLVSVGAGVIAWQQRGEALARARTSASQALAARALDSVDKDPRKAAQFALYAQEVEATGESAQALAQAVVANESVTRHLQAGNEVVANFRGAGNVPATNVAISNDGSKLAYYSDLDPDDPGNQRGYIHLYDVRAGRALPHLKGGGWPQNGGGMQFSADGRVLAVEGPNNRIDVWDVARQKRIRTISASNGQELAEVSQGLRAFAFSGDGQRLAAAFFSPEQSDFHVAVWDATTGRQLLKEPAAPDSLTLGFDDSGRLLALDSQAGTLRTLAPDSTSWSNPRKIPGFPRQELARQVTLSADGSKAYIGAQHEIWDLVKGRRLASAGEQDIGTIAMPGTQDGAVYAAGGRGVGVYDAALRRRRVLGSFTWPVFSMSVSGDGRWVAAGSQDGAVSLYSTTSFQAGEPLPNKQQVVPADMAPDQRTTFRTGRSGTDVWAITGDGVRKLGRVPLRLVKQTPREDTLIASPDGTRAVVRQEQKLSLWNLRDGSRVGREMTGSQSFMPMAFLADGLHVVGTTTDHLQVVSTKSWKVLQSVPFHREDGYAALSISADRTTLALLEDKELSVWKWTTENELHQVRGVSIESVWTMHGHNVMVSAKGDRVALVNSDQLISVLDVSTGKFVAGTSTASGSSVLAFSPDATLLVQATGSGEDQRLQFWDATTGESRGTWALPRQGNAKATIERLLTGDDGSVIAFGTDGSLVKRTIDLARWKEVLCDLAPGELPQEEYDRYLEGLDVGAPCR